ncbi:DUF4352 domain-containing protein [Agrococcus baldri]|uniref:DUF4352 domain-containing protein n=1 Tax=Agrococcus baldri TaxID=153730 RepID=A0AA87USF9_9MICO|nr:DUF4352 domain-containing protein [Agrococcus baldri]GEK80818.1 hypothetical protein ABA31_21690 [Agrococcus baldri]
MPSRIVTRRRGRGSNRLGAALVAAAALGLGACVAMPATTPGDPEIPASPTPVFTDLAPPPTTNGPTDPPVPTTAPGDYAYGDTATIHTDRGSTWEVTVLDSVDPADSLAAQTGSTPRAGERFVVMNLEITNVGAITTHPMHDMTFGYQPDGGPVADQNSASIAAAPNDLGYIWEFAPGDSHAAQVIVSIRADAATSGAWLISPTDSMDQARLYRWS